MLLLLLLLLSRFSCVWLCDPIRQQPTRLSHPWDSPGKNTGVGCHFLLQCMKVKSEREVAVISDSSRSHGLQPTRLHEETLKNYWQRYLLNSGIEVIEELYLLFGNLEREGIFTSCKRQAKSSVSKKKPLSKSSLWWKVVMIESLRNFFVCLFLCWFIAHFPPPPNI